MFTIPGISGTTPDDAGIPVVYTRDDPVVYTGDIPVVYTENGGMSRLDRLQTGLDVIGVLDPSPISDGVNAVIYLGRGQWGNAAISAGAIIPYLGDSLV